MLASQAAGSDTAADLNVARPTPPGAYEVTFGHLPWKTSGPFVGWTKNFRRNPLPYRIDITAVTFSRPMGTADPESFWTHFDFLRSAVWSSITRGPENHWGGLATGLRYNHAWRGLPGTSLFASFQGGVGAIDSSRVRYAQAKDLTFTYLAAIGVRARISKTVDADFQVLGQHISNGWQTRPSEGIDCSGFSLAVRYRPTGRR